MCGEAGEQQREETSIHGVRHRWDSGYSGGKGGNSGTDIYCLLAV